MTVTNIAPWLAQSRWPTAPIRLVARLGSGHTPSRSVPEYWENCTVPWITLADVWQLRRGDVSVISETKEKVSPLGLAHSAAVKHSAGTVILSRTASVGFSAIMGTDMATSQDFATWTCGPRLDPRFLLHALRGMAPDLVRVATGSTHKTIYMPDIEQLRVPLPPLEEQRRIADFLDAETARIDRMAAIRRQQIDLLGSSEASIIGEYLESIAGTPTRVKHLATRITSGPRGWGDLVADQGSLFLRITNVPRRGITLDLDDSLYVTTPSGPERERSRTRPGDVLVSITADIGSVAIVDDRATDANISQHVAMVRPDQSSCNPTWLAYAIKSARSNQSLRMNSYGGTKVGLGLGDVANLAIEVPDLKTQEQSASRITQILVQRENLRRRMIVQRALLAERRQALITAAVTGQFDVSTASGRNVTDGVTA